MVPIGLVMTVGKYLLVGLIYLFVFLVFRALLKEMAVARAAAIAPVAVRPPIATPPTPAAAPSATAAAAPVVETPTEAPVALPAPSRAAPSLIVESAPEGGLATGTVFPLTAAVTIGRASQNAIVIGDRFASSHHAIVFLQDGRRILRDRGSTNGTLHNGERLQGDVELKIGDRITIGTTVFRLV